MKKRMAKRIITFLLAVVMAAAMPISINAAESPAAPLSVNAKTASFSYAPKLYFEEYGGGTVYGEYHTTVVFQSASDTSNEVYSAIVSPGFVWNKELPAVMEGTCTVSIVFQALYQRVKHYSYGNVTQTHYAEFDYNNESRGIFKAPHTFYIEEPTDDPLGFKNWVSFNINIYIYLPTWEKGDDPLDFASVSLMTVQHIDVINQF